MFQSLKQWYLALPPRRRTVYGVLISIIVATIPCYCIGGWAMVRGIPVPNRPPAAVATATPMPTLEPTPTQSLAPTEPPTPTQTPTSTLEPTPTQAPTSTETPTALPTETATPMPTETATVTPGPTETPTGTATSMPTPSDTPTLEPIVTLTSTPVILGTVGPPPELSLSPTAGPPGTEISITGKHFSPYKQYLLYWDAPESPIGTALADDVGQVHPVVFAVPPTASVQVHQVMISLDGTVVARASFAVTTADAD